MEQINKTIISNLKTLFAVTCFFLVCFISNLTSAADYYENYVWGDFIPSNESQQLYVDVTGNIPSGNIVTSVHVQAVLQAFNSTALESVAARFDSDSFPADGEIFFKKEMCRALANKQLKKHLALSSMELIQTENGNFFSGIIVVPRSRSMKLL